MVMNYYACIPDSHLEIQLLLDKFINMLMLYLINFEASIRIEHYPYL